MPYRVRQRMRLFLAAYLLASYGAAWAAIVHLGGPDLLSWPWAQTLVGVGVSWLGGLAATLGRMVSATYDGKPFHIHREFVRDGAVSAVIGIAGYAGAMSQGASAEALVLVLLVGGYAGTRTLAIWFERIIAARG